ncbi:MAG: TIGR00725 family protein [Dehalococcoidia bacterium]|nr:TIGR00725 family protein [Dehalococcoidia bacterium]
MQHALSISVIGASRCSPDEAVLAEEVGRQLARNGVILICGGLTGVVEAACKGASDAGGTTIGILPGDSAADANPYVKIPIVTSIGYSRNVIVVKSAHAVIAIGGAYGTLSEIAYALQSGIPVVGLNTWALSRPLSTSGQTEEDTSILRASTASDAVELALSLARARLEETK